MQHARRLPPLLRALFLLGLLFALASLGVETWAFGVLRDHWEPSAARGQALAGAFLLLALACNWPVAAYNARFLLAQPWLSTWRGQLAAALGLAALPMGVVAVVLLLPVTRPLNSLQFLLDTLAGLVLGAASVWALALSSSRG